MRRRHASEAGDAMTATADFSACARRVDDADDADSTVNGDVAMECVDVEVHDARQSYVRGGSTPVLSAAAAAARGRQSAGVVAVHRSTHAAPSVVALSVVALSDAQL